MALQFDVNDMYMSAKTPEDSAQRLGFFTGIRLTTEKYQKDIIRSETEITQLQRECNALAMSRDTVVEKRDIMMKYYKAFIALYRNAKDANINNYKSERDEARKERDELKTQLAILKAERDTALASSPST